MRSRFWLVLAGVALALGAMVWWSRPARLRGAPTPRPAATQPASRPASQPAPPPQSARAALARGTVVDAEGRPVAGARVIAVTRPPVLDRGAAGAPPAVRPDGGDLGVYRGPLPFPDEVAGPSSAPASRPAALETALVDREVGRAVTDEAGAFVLTGLPPAPLELRVTHPGYPCNQHLRIDLEGGGERSGLRIALSRGATVRGRITDARGAAVARAVVAPELADSVGAESDAEGRYSFGPVCGPLRLVASAPGLRSQAHAVTPPAGERDVTLDFRLERDAESVRGRVLDQRDRPATGVRVTATGTGAGRAPVSTVSGPHGEFVLGGLGPGPYRLATSGEGSPAAVQEGVQPGEDVTLRLPAGGAIAGLVREERAGAAVPRYEVTVTGRGAAPAVRRSGARFDVRPLAAGTWRVTVRAPGYVTFTRDVEVAGGERPGVLSTTDVLVELVRGAVASGEVRDDRGDRVAGATVAVGPRSTLTGPRGEFRLGELPDGEQVLRVTKAGHAPAQVTVRLRAGDETRGVAVELPRRQ